MLGTNLIYKVEGKYWDVALADYVSEPTPGKEVVELVQAGHPADEAYLGRTLAFYNFPLGKFAPTQTQKTLEERLAELEAEMASIKEQLQSASSNETTSTNGGLSYGV